MAEGQSMTTAEVTRSFSGIARRSVPGYYVAGHSHRHGRYFPSFLEPQASVRAGASIPRGIGMSKDTLKLAPAGRRSDRGCLRGSR